MTRRMWTPDEDALLIKTDKKLTPAQQGARLGRSYDSVVQRRSHLARVGKLAPRVRYASRAWTERDDHQLLDLVSNGLPVAQIARTLKRGVDATYMRAWQLAGGVSQIRRDLLAVRSAAAVARLFGVSRAMPYTWIEQGWLAAKRNPKPRQPSGKRPPRTEYLISDMAILHFLSVREAWPTWEPARMTDADWRSEAEEIRAAAGGHWIAVTDWARMCHYENSTAWNWVKQGRIQGMRCGWQWYVWSVDAAQFVPPMERPDYRRAA